MNAQQQRQPGSLTWNIVLAKQQKPDSNHLSFASRKAAMPSHITGQQNKVKKKKATTTPLPKSPVFKGDKLKRAGWEYVLWIQTHPWHCNLL